MSDSRSTPASDNTLYDPPERSTESVPEKEGEVELELELSPELAEQLSDVATHLGLSPSIIAARAIDMVCEEVGLVKDRELSSTTLIQKYQTRLDLLHSLDYSLEVDPSEEEAQAGGSDSEAYDWDDVDNIIGRVTEASDEE
jgi:hypothetical protein